MTLKVGRSKFVSPKNQQTYILSYNDVEKDVDGWVDASKYLPIDFDLLIVKTKESSFPAWSVGNHWDGVRVTDKTEVLFWKKRDYYSEG